jgi:hypothetical protein
VTLRSRHLTDDRLCDSYFTDRQGEPIDPTVADHLTDCGTCGDRYAELAQFLDVLRDSADTEADAIFTADRLQAQQRQIARRIDHVGRAARVINFPRPFNARTILASSSHKAPRWIAAAAAAGLFIGVALGASYKSDWRSDPRRDASAARSRTAVQATAHHAAALTPLATRGSVPPDIAADDAFLSDLEMSLDRPRSRELQALDALTPHVREVRDLR